MVFLINKRIECCRYSILVDKYEAAFIVDSMVDFKRFVYLITFEISRRQQRQCGELHGTHIPV